MRARMLALLVGAMMALAAPVQADAVLRMADALQIDRLMRVLSEEGMQHADEVRAEMFPDQSASRWEALVTALYQPARLRQMVLADLRRAFGDDPSADRIAAFFEAEPGARIITLELAAREAILDPQVLEAAEAGHDALVAGGAPLLDQIARLIAAGDLVERNVAGAMNANLAFFNGMMQGGAMAEVLPDADLMADLWSQEPMIRAEIEGWLWPYLSLAYEPLAEADLETYIAFAESPDGLHLNAVLFDVFEVLFNRLSADLGLAVAGMLLEQDL